MQPVRGNGRINEWNRRETTKPFSVFDRTGLIHLPPENEETRPMIGLRRCFGQRFFICPRQFRGLRGRITWKRAEIGGERNFSRETNAMGPWRSWIAPPGEIDNCCIPAHPYLHRCWTRWRACGGNLIFGTGSGCIIWRFFY